MKEETWFCHSFPGFGFVLVMICFIDWELDLRFNEFQGGLSGNTLDYFSTTQQVRSGVFIEKSVLFACFSL